MPKFGRKVVVQLGNRSYEDLRISFDIRKTLTGEPNTAEITIYNLGWVTVGDLALDFRNLRVRLLAGYETPSLLFEGNITHDGFTIEETGSDRILRVSAQTGIRAYQSARVRASFEAGTTYRQLFKDIVRQMGFPTSVIPDTSGMGKKLQTGMCFSGEGALYLDRLSASLGLDWSIQDGSEVQFVPKGQTLPERGPRYSPELGNLVGSPRPTDIGADVTVLLDPIRPGQRYQVDKVSDSRLNGQFRADAVQFVGDSGFDNSFYTIIEGRRLRT